MLGCGTAGLVESLQRSQSSLNHRRESSGPGFGQSLAGSWLDVADFRQPRGPAPG